MTAKLKITRTQINAVAAVAMQNDIAICVEHEGLKLTVYPDTKVGDRVEDASQSSLDKWRKNKGKKQ